MRASLQSITVLLTSLFVLLCLENQHPDRQPEHHRHVRVFLHSVVRYCRGGRYWYVARQTVQIRVVHGSIMCDPIQPNPSAD